MLQDWQQLKLKRNRLRNPSGRAKLIGVSSHDLRMTHLYTEGQSDKYYKAKRSIGAGEPRGIDPGARVRLCQKLVLGTIPTYAEVPLSTTTLQAQANPFCSPTILFHRVKATQTCSVAYIPRSARLPFILSQAL